MNIWVYTTSSLCYRLSIVGLESRCMELMHCIAWMDGMERIIVRVVDDLDGFITLSFFVFVWLVVFYDGFGYGVLIVGFLWIVMMCGFLHWRGGNDSD